jgi:hypothetical protein
MALNKYFSTRRGYQQPQVDIQVDSMSDDLRVTLWNVLSTSVWRGYQSDSYMEHGNKNVYSLLVALWVRYFKKPLDEFPRYWHQWEDILKNFILTREWHKVYELIEFMLDHWDDEYSLDHVIVPALNRGLELELSAYRVINRVVTPITDSAEISSIEAALEQPDVFRPIKLQLEDALRKLSDKEHPDYRGSIKDSISAVETLCRILTKEPKLELGKALKALEGKGISNIHGALREGFIRIYGWTSDDQGIRHGLMDEPNLNFEDAKYMLVSCSAFVNYLIAKAARAGIALG